VDAILVLDREEEARLARRIEFARLRLTRARKRVGLDGDLLEALRRDKGSSRSLPRDVVRRTEELHALRTEMVERNLYLVLINVERYVQDPSQRIDLVQEGCASLFRATDGFDWRRGLLFRTYAVHWLNQAFRNYIYNFRSTVRVPVYLQKALKHVNEAQIHLGKTNATPDEIAKKAEMDPNLVEAAMSAARSTYSMDAALNGDDDSDGNRLRDLLADQDGDLYRPFMEDVDLKEGLARAMENLSEREQLVVRMRFGIGVPNEHTLAEVAAKLGVSVERVRQIQVRAIAKMNTPGLRRDLEPFLTN
jgi:RNA polymerase primary sigma factor